MTGTDTYQALLTALDTQPKDRHLLLVIADCCDDHSYGTGAGWRALERLGKCPHYFSGSQDWGWWSGEYFYTADFIKRHLPSKLPDDWFVVLANTEWGRRVWCVGTIEGAAQAYAEAATAFLLLPSHRQQELLEGDR